MKNQAQTKATSLQAKILAVNTINKHSLYFINFELQALQAHKGKDIFKVDGSFKQKYFREFQPIRERVKFAGFDWWIDSHYYLKFNYGKIILHVRTSVTGGGQDQHGVNARCIYEERSFNLLTYPGAIGEEIEQDRTHLEKEYNEQELKEAAEKAKEAAKAYEKAAEAVPHIFRDVLDVQRLTY